MEKRKIRPDKLSYLQNHDVCGAVVIWLMMAALFPYNADWYMSNLSITIGLLKGFIIGLTGSYFQILAIGKSPKYITRIHKIILVIMWSLLGAFNYMGFGLPCNFPNPCRFNDNVYVFYKDLVDLFNIYFVTGAILLSFIIAFSITIFFRLRERKAQKITKSKIYAR